MNSERVRYREEREIDLFDLFIEVLLHWRGLIIAMVIGGLIFGGYSLYGSYKANASAKAEVAALEEKKAKTEEEEQLEAERTEEVKKQLLELEKKLTETQKVNVESVLTYEKQLIRFENYQKKAVIMKVNPEEVPIGNITIRVIADEDRVSDIEKAYEDLLVSQDMFKHISSKCDIGSDISELIGIDQLTYSTESEADTLKLWVIGETEEKCSEMVEAICNHATEMSNSLQEKLGAHELSVVGTSVNLSYSSDIYDRQQSNQNSIISLKTTIASKVDGFSDDEKAYYELKKSGIIKEADEEENTEEETIPTIPPIEISKKKLGIGVIGGLFVYAFVICIGYVFDGKVKDSDDFERLFGIRTIGKIYGAGDKRANKKGLDGAIYSLKRRGSKPVVQNSAEKMIAINTAALVTKEEAENVAIICGDFDAAGLVERIKETITAEEKNAEVFESLLYSSTETQELENIDSAILVVRTKKSRYNETEEMIKLLENRGIMILGGIVG